MPSNVVPGCSMFDIAFIPMFIPASTKLPNIYWVLTLFIIIIIVGGKGTYFRDKLGVMNLKINTVKRH